MTATLTRPRRAKVSPLFDRNVVCHSCGAAGTRDSRDCRRCAGSGFTKGPEHRGVALNALTPSQRNLRDARRGREVIAPLSDQNLVSAGAERPALRKREGTGTSELALPTTSVKGRDSAVTTLNNERPAPGGSGRAA